MLIQPYVFAMRCNSTEFDSVKPMLSRLGLKMKGKFDFQKKPFIMIINNQISNVSINKVAKKATNVYNHWDKNVLLTSCIS